MSLSATRFTRTNRSGLPYIGHHFVSVPRPLPAVVPASSQVPALFLRRLPVLTLAWSNKAGTVRRFVVSA